MNHTSPRILVLPRTPYVGAFVSFCVWSREEAKGRRPLSPYVMISITDHGAEPVELALSKHCAGVLRLTFDDVDSPHGREIPHGFHAMTMEQGRQVVEFVQGARDAEPLFIVHCTAGVSRSAGVAAALSRWLNGEDAWFYAHFAPNAWCRSCVLGSVPVGELG